MELKSADLLFFLIREEKMEKTKARKEVNAKVFIVE